MNINKIFLNMEINILSIICNYMKFDIIHNINKHNIKKFHKRCIYLFIINGYLPINFYKIYKEYYFDDENINKFGEKILKYNIKKIIINCSRKNIINLKNNKINSLIILDEEFNEYFNVGLYSELQIVNFANFEINNFNNLEYLCLSSNAYIKNKNLSLLKNLKYLNLFHGEQITDEVICLLIKLEYLKLYHNKKLTDKGIFPLKKLKYLNLFHNKNITNKIFTLLKE